MTVTDRDIPAIQWIRIVELDCRAFSAYVSNTTATVKVVEYMYSSHYNIDTSRQLCSSQLC